LKTLTLVTKRLYFGVDALRLRDAAERVLLRVQGLPPERVGEVVWKALSSRYPRVRYAVVPGGVLRGSVPSFVPRRLIDRVIAHLFGLSPRRR